MKLNFIDCGKIVGVHGIKGTLKFELWCNGVSFLKGFKTLYADKNGEKGYEIINVNAHGNIALLNIKGIDTVEKAQLLRGTVLYIKREDAVLPKGKYFISELLGCEVYNDETNEKLGIIKDVFNTGANDIWTVELNGKEYLVPIIPDTVVNIDVENCIAKILPLKGVFDDEN